MRSGLGPARRVRLVAQHNPAVWEDRAQDRAEPVAPDLGGNNLIRSCIHGDHLRLLEDLLPEAGVQLCPLRASKLGRKVIHNRARCLRHRQATSSEGRQHAQHATAHAQCGVHGREPYVQAALSSITHQRLREAQTGI